MKEYIASVKDKKTKEIKIITSVYNTKKEYAEDLKRNGYSVRFITTENKFDEDCEKYYEKNRINSIIRKNLYESDKKHAEKMGMSVKEYRNWLK